MNEETKVPQMNRHESTDESIKGNSGNIAKAWVEERIGIYLGIISVVASAVALTVVIMKNSALEDKIADLKDRTILAETEMRLVDDWLVTHGVEKRNGRYVFKEERVNGE